MTHNDQLASIKELKLMLAKSCTWTIVDSDDLDIPREMDYLTALQHMESGWEGISMRPVRWMDDSTPVTEQDWLFMS